MSVQRGMEAVAVVLGIAALALIFAPERALAQLGWDAGAGAVIIAQLYGAALFGIAMTTYTARTMLLGGIYGRAIVVGGFAHALVGAFALLRAVRASQGNAFVWGACGAYVALAIFFGALMFGRGPASPADDPSS